MDRSWDVASFDGFGIGVQCETCEVSFAYLAFIIIYDNHKNVKALVC